MNQEAEQAGITQLSQSHLEKNEAKEKKNHGPGVGMGSVASLHRVRTGRGKVE